MANAVTQLQVATGGGPTLTSGESGFKYSREDSLSGSTPTPLSNPGPGTNYSWIKWLLLGVLTPGTTNISNRRVQLSAPPTTGLYVFFQGNGTYAQASSGNKAPDSASNGAIPSGYTMASTSPQVYDSSSVSSGSTGRNGNYCQTCMGVDATYSGMGSTSIPMPDIRFLYDEA